MLGHIRINFLFVFLTAVFLFCGPSAYAAQLLIRYSVAPVDDRACESGGDAEQAYSAVLALGKQAAVVYNNHFGQHPGCDGKPGSFTLIRNFLFYGSDEDINYLKLLTPKTFNGRHMSFNYEVIPVKSLTARYSLGAVTSTDVVEDVFVRSLNVIEFELHEFQNRLCDNGSPIRHELKGTPKEKEAIEHLDRHPDFTLGFDIDVVTKLNSLPAILIKGHLTSCTWGGNGRTPL